MPKQRPTINSRARQWADEQQFKGHGRITCNACGEPLRDHVLTEPCPATGLRAGEVTTPSAASAAQERRRNSESDSKETR